MDDVFGVLIAIVGITVVIIVGRIEVHLASIADSLSLLAAAM